MAVVVQAPFNIDINFWTNNSSFKIVDPFSKLYDRDKSKNKNNSSKEMWCLWMLTNPSSTNPIRRLSREEKERSLKQYYSKFDLKDKLIQKAVGKFEDFAYSAAAKTFREAQDALIARTNLIRGITDRLERIQEGKEKTIYTKKETGETFEVAIDLFDKDVQSAIKSLEQMHKNTPVVFKGYEEAESIFLQEQGDNKVFGGGSLGLMDKGGFDQIDLSKLNEEE